MKNLLFIIAISITVIIVSCGPSQDDIKKKAAEDSIKRIDSISNLVTGTWKAEGKGASLTIEKSGELYTITTAAGVIHAYKLNGQILSSVDGTGTTYSIIGNGELLTGSTKFTKTDDNSSSISSETSTKEKTTTTTEGKSHSSSTSNSAIVSATTTASTVTSTPSELTIISDNTVNIRQSPAVTSTVIRGVSNGQVCKLLEKGKQATIGGKTDYWYKVSVSGDKGWIFGSYTSLHQQ